MSGCDNETPRPCVKCGSTRRRESDGRCIDCDTKRTRERRARARGNFDEHYYAPVANDKGELVHEGNAEIPENYAIRGVSQYDPTTRRWLKTERIKRDKIQAVLDAVSGVAERINGMAEPRPTPDHVDDDILNLFPFGDPHIGLYAWAKETDDRDFDLDKAEAIMFGAVDHLSRQCMPAKHAIVCSAGDLLHADNQSNQTARSGHHLDVDTRYAKVYQVAFATLIRVLNRVLENHETVRFISVIGNHDDHSAFTLAHAVQCWYRNEPRLTVDLHNRDFHWHRFGKCLLGFTHGHTCKPNDLDGVMSTDRPKDWGETIWRHWVTGHVHNRSFWELHGCTAETLRTLTPRDKWTASRGYRSGQDMRVQAWHREWGPIGGAIVSTKQLLAQGVKG